MKYFYSHLIEIDSIILELDKMNLNEEEKLHLAQAVDSTMHPIILDAVLSELSESDKKVFIKHLNSGNHGRIWGFLNDKIEGLEDKIKKVAEDLKKELHRDLREAHKRK